MSDYDNSVESARSRRNFLAYSALGTVGSFAMGAGSAEITEANKLHTAPIDPYAGEANAFGTGATAFGAGAAALELKNSPDLTRREALGAFLKTTAAIGAANFAGREVGNARMKRQEIQMPANEEQPAPIRVEDGWQARVEDNKDKTTPAKKITL